MRRNCILAMAVAVGALFFRGEAAASDLSLLHVFDGGVANAQFGISCVVVGDMDGDGFAEFAIGASADSTAGKGAGRVFIYRGGPQYLGDPPAWIIDGAPGDLLGAALAPAGDVDGDGLADLLIGAPGSLDLNPSATGRVLLVYGCRPLGTRAPVSIPGPIAGGHFGAAVAGLGAFNGDRYSDVAVGAPNANAGAGEVLVYLGSPTGLASPALVLHGSASGDNFGTAVAGAGRTRGGTYSDLLVGAPFNSDATIWAGKAYLYLGGAVPDSTPDAQYAGVGAGDFLGTSLAGAGDVNGDGFDDFLVGAPDANPGALIDAGQAYLFLGAAAPPAGAALTVSGTRANGELGLAVAGIGDENADGFADFAVGTPGGADSTFAGETRVFLGRPSPVAVADTVLAGENGGDMFGRAISNGGLVDAGTHALFLVGSYLHAGAGRGYLYGSSNATVGVAAEAPPAGVRLTAPWPDPASGSVRFSLEVGTPRPVRLQVLDVSGRRIAMLADGEVSAGRREIVWPGSGQARPPAGLYWVVLESAEVRQARRFVLLGP